VRGTLLIKGGARAVPNQKLGLGAITALSQRTGGSIHTPTPKLDDALADLAADIEVNAGPLAFSFDFGCLSSDAPRVLALVSELAREPLFPEDRVAAARQQILSSLEHADDDAGGVARRRLLEILYGKDSLYARHPTTKTAGSVTRTDVAAFAKRWQRPDAAVLGVTGDFDAAEMRALVEQAFGDWKPAPGEPVEPPVAPSSRPPRLPSNEEELLLLAGGGGGGGGGSSSSPQQQQQQQQPLVLLLNRPGLQQATVLLGEPGLSIADPDAPSLDVLASVFNSFGGALFDAVRSREGLAYSVAASWDTPSDHRGIFLASADTSRPADLLIELRRALGQAVVASGKGGSGSGGVSSEAVARALDQALEQYAFSVGGSSSRLARALSYDVLGLPQDFAQQYRDKLAAVTRESVVEAARRWLHPDSQAGQVAVVAADAAAVRPELEAAGFRVAVLPMMTQQAGES
jgi:zinc protease